MRALPRRLAPWLGAALAAGLLPLLPGAVADDVAGEAAGAATPLRAGAAAVDVTWHVGASQGQYAGEGPGVHDSREGTVDPHAHATASDPTYGIESRDTVRALVMDDGDGGRWALVTNDLYIPQDLVNQRVATLLAEHDAAHPDRATGITADDLTVSVSHSHSSPFYSSTTWGAWAFQDVFDIRFFEFVAKGMADAVIAAAGDLRPARAAVAQVPVAISKRNPESPTVSDGDEQLPSGWAQDDDDGALSLLRVEDVSGDAPAPLASWVVFGRHPEGMKDNGLHTGEYVGNLLRTLDRELGGVTLFSQNDTGSSEIARDAKAHPGVARQEYDENSHNMIERVARDLADAVHGAADAVERERRSPRAPQPPGTAVVLVGPEAPVAVTTQRFAPPSYRPFATVSNCRAERAAGGDVGIPVVGLPDCAYVYDVGQHSPVDPGVAYSTLREAGVPVPDSYGFPSFVALQESTHVVLQAVRLGTAAITVCPCEMFAEQSRNTRSRLDKVDGNLWFGSDWTAHHRFSEDFEPGVAYLGDLLPDAALGEGVRRGPLQLDIDPRTPGEQWWCEPDDRSAPTQWTCKDPRPLAGSVHEVPASWDGWPVLAPVSHEAFVRWKARMYNDARGWDAYVGSPETVDALQAESEPTDPARIWGNWTQEEHTEHGYDLVVTVSMSNDYWGYIPTYQQWQERDFYRKALAALGPHSSDFFATRLARMAASLNGGPAVELNPKDLAYSPGKDAQTAKATAIGRIAEAYLPVYEAGLPADGGTPGTAVEQPRSISRYDATTFRWTGGSNYADVPHARVERLDPDGQWRPFGDGYGEVQVRAQMPAPEDLPRVAAGQFAWTWTAAFEAFSSDVDRTFADGVRRSQVPEGTYRFVVDGCARGTVPDGAPDAACSEWDATGRVQPYHVESEAFTVSPWQGLTASASGDRGDVVVDVGPDPAAPLPALNASRRTFTSSTSLVGLPAIRYRSGRYDYGTADAVDYPDGPSASPFARYLVGRGENDLRQYGDGPQLFCFRCAFEPWSDAGAVESVVVTVTRAGGGVEQVRAVFDPATRRWRAPTGLQPGDTARVLPGGVVDAFGERNGTPSEVVAG